MQGINYFESGNPCDSSEIVLRLAYDLYADMFAYARPFVYHPVKTVKLCRFNEKMNTNFSVLVNTCDDEWYDCLDKWLVNDGPTRPEFSPVVAEIYSKEILTWDQREEMPTGLYPSQLMYHWVPEAMLCDQHLVEATMFSSGTYTSGVSHLIKSVWNFATTPTADRANEIIQRWCLEFIDLAINCSVGKLIMSFVKLLSEFLPISGLLEKIHEITTHCYEYLKDKYASPQPPLDDSVEPTSSIGFFLDSYDNVPAIAAALAAGSTLFASLFVVTKISASKSKCIWEAAADGFHAIGKFRTGFMATAAMMKEFAATTYDAVFQSLIGEKEGTLYKLISKTKVSDSDSCKKAEFFSYIEYLLNPANLLDIHASEVSKMQMNFCLQIVDSIRKNCADNPLEAMPTQTKEYVNKIYEKLLSLEKEIKKRPVVEPVRFTPFWVNIIGDSGVGKSVFVPLLTEYLRKTLEQIQIDTQEDFELPSKENWFFPVNFTDKYLTHYNGHYIVAIDDFLQDAPGVLETASPLSLIQWVSAVPYFTNQASLEDKGTPFTSKFIISTSNDTSINRKEITCAGALRRRIQVNVFVSHDKGSNAQPDELFGTKPLKFSLIEPGSESATRKFKNSRELISYIIAEYVKWYRAEKKVLASRHVKTDELNDVVLGVRDLLRIVDYDNKTIVPSTTGDPPKLIVRDVEPTVSWRCMLGRTPNMKVVYVKTVSGDEKSFTIYNCDCDFHEAWNNSYISYRKVAINPQEIHQYISYDATQEQLHQNNLNRFLESIKIRCEQLWNASSLKWVKYILAGMATYAAYAVISSGKTITAEQSDDEDSGTDVVEGTKAQYNISRPGRVAPKIARVEATSNIEPFLSSAINKQAYDIAYSSIISKGAVCNLSFKRDGKDHTGTALRIGGRVILTNHHYFDYMLPGEKFCIQIHTNADGLQKVEQQYNPKYMQRLGDIDACIYVCDTALTQAKCLLKHFTKNTVMAKYTEALVLTLHPHSKIPMLMANVVAEPNTTVKYEYGLGMSNTSTYNILDSYKTNCPVERGMSGSVLFATSNGIKEKILGIQTSRNRADLCGYFKPISQEMLQIALDKLDVNLVESNDVEPTFLIEGKRPPNLGNGSLEFLGALPKNKIVRGQKETKIQPSLVHDEYQVTQEPSVLDDYDNRMKDELIGKPVIYRAMEGFDHPIGSIDRPLLSKCVDELAVEYDIALDVTSIPRRLLNDLEMINGVPGIINRVDMKTSPGYPYVLERTDTTRGGKFEWFDEVEPFEGYTKVYQMKPSLASGLEQAEKQLLSGQQYQVVAYACLKDETRPLAKVADGKTRAFICLPLDYNLLIRKYFGAFIAALHSKAGKVTSCVGIDPAKQWKDIYYKLMEKNCFWEDFDYANWDQHLHPELVMKVANIVNYWYGDSATSPAGKVRSLLLETLIHTTIIVKDKVFRKSSGQCSGCAITAELNCLVHDILMYYMWRKLAILNKVDTDLCHYRLCVASIMYGDDIVMSVVPEMQSMFNGNTIKPLMIELGMNITPGDKISTEFKMKDPSEVLFLKRGFRVDGEFVKAPLRSDIVSNIYQWIHKSDDAVEATISNCYTSLRESYMHGCLYFNSSLVEINDKIKDFNRKGKAQLRAIALSYDDLDAKYRDEEFVCSGLVGLEDADALS